MKFKKIVNKITGRTKAVKEYQKKINHLKKSNVNVTKKYIKDMLNNNQNISILKEEINKISIKIKNLRLKNKPLPNNLLIEQKKLKYIFNKEYLKELLNSVLLNGYFKEYRPSEYDKFKQEIKLILNNNIKFAKENGIDKAQKLIKEKMDFIYQFINKNPNIDYSDANIRNKLIESLK
jgi:hypothetical protein